MSIAAEQLSDAIIVVHKMIRRLKLQCEPVHATKGATRGAAVQVSAVGKPAEIKVLAREMTKKHGATVANTEKKCNRRGETEITFSFHLQPEQLTVR